MKAEIHRAILDAYGFLARPKFDFVERRFRNRPYVDLLTELGSYVAIVDTTDLNDDVAIALALSAPSLDIGLRLSLVGHFAAISARDGRILNPEEVSRLAGIEPVLEIITKYGIQLIGRSDLLEPIDFDDRKVPLYEILFSSDEAINL